MIVSFIGPPGCGKSTQIEFVTQSFLDEIEIVKLRVPDLIKKHPSILPYLTEKEIEIVELLTQASNQCRDNGRLSPIELDDILFNVAERCVEDGKHIVLDGAPRGVKQAKMYCQRKKLKDETVVVHLSFNNQAYENSVSRQFYRESLSRGVETAVNKIQRFRNKFHTYNTDTLKGLQILKEHEISCVEINALLSKSEVSQHLEQFLTKQMLLRISTN